MSVREERLGKKGEGVGEERGIRGWFEDSGGKGRRSRRDRKRKWKREERIGEEREERGRN